MKRLLLFLACFVYGFAYGYSQIQTGYVRTTGRPNNKSGERVPGVEIRVSGLHGAIISGQDGAFDINLQKDTNSYQLIRVYKEGFELNEKEVLGRKLPVSPIPQELVMVSKAEKMKIQQNVEKQIEKLYQEKYDELLQLYTAKQIEATEFQKRIVELESINEKREQLIAQMAERYSHTDYATLGETDALINAFIEQGELEKADSLINASYNIAQMEKDLSLLNSSIDDHKQKIQQEENARENLTQQLKLIYEEKHDLFSANLQFDSAAIYLVKMAYLDTTDLDFILFAGEYCQSYAHDFDNALKLIDLYIAQCEHFGEMQNVRLWIGYEEKGDFYHEVGMYDNAIKMYQKSLDCALAKMDSSNFILTSTYRKMGQSLINLGKYTEALELFEKCKEILMDAPDFYKRELIGIYIAQGVYFSELGNYQHALEMDKMALDLKLSQDEDTTNVACATIYNNLGTDYGHLKRYEEALQMFQKSLNIYLSIYGEENALIADEYGNIGDVHMRLRHDEEALEWYTKSLNLYTRIYGEIHPSVAQRYDNLCTYYANLDQYEQALIMGQKNLEINLSLYKKPHRAVIQSYSNLGVVLAHLDRMEESLQMRKKAVVLMDSVEKVNKHSIALYYERIGMDYYNIQHYEEALEMFQIGYERIANLDGEMHLNTAHFLLNIASMNLTLQRYQEVEIACKKLISIYKDLGTTEDLVNAYDLLGVSLLGQNMKKDAKKIYNKVLRLAPEYYKSKLDSPLLKAFTDIN